MALRIFVAGGTGVLGRASQIGPAANYFSSIYVPDAGQAVTAAVNAPAGIYNVCDNEPVFFAEYLRIMTSAIGVKPPAFAGISR